MNITICSLNFSPQHVAHLAALVELFFAVDCKVALYLDAAYTEWSDYCGAAIVSDESGAYGEDVDLLLVYNIGAKHLGLMRRASTANTRTAYVLHEPYPGFLSLLSEGHSLPRMVGASMLNAFLVKTADTVLLPSRFAKSKYEAHMAFLNQCYSVLPLVFRDEYVGTCAVDRQYFSFIGGFTDPHNREQFLEFVKYASYADESVRFLIATSTNLSDYLRRDWLAALIDEKRVVVRHGKFLTTEEINMCYRESICVWAVYNKATQSGVVVNAMMQATPVIARDVGSMTDEVEDGVTGVLLPSEFTNEQILDSYRLIKSNLDYFEFSTRSAFLKKHWSGSQVDPLRLLLPQLTGYDKSATRGGASR